MPRGRPDFNSPAPPSANGWYPSLHRAHLRVPSGSAILLELTIIFALILANGAFSGAEIAILSVRRTRVSQLAEGGSVRAKAVARLRAEPERLLATIAVGVTIVASAASAFGGASVATRLKEIFERVGVGKYADELALASVVAGISFTTIVLGELVPKSLALRSAEPYALLASRPLLGIAWVARPMVWLLSAASNGLLKLFGDRTTFVEARMSPEELRQLVQEAGMTGQMDPGASELATRALDFERLGVLDALVPREQMVCLARDAHAADVNRCVARHGHARIPVYEGTQDNIVGYVTARDVFQRLADGKDVALGEILRAAYFVPETMRALDAMRELQKRRVHLAIVVDDAGGVRGLITIEDLVEELVGEIVHEHERLEEPVVREVGGTALVQGATPIREVNRKLGLDLDEPRDRTTMAGLMIALAGKIPRAGDRVVAGGVELEVVEASPRKVHVVRVRPPGSRARNADQAAESD